MCPERRESEQMRELLTKNTRRTSLESPYNFVRGFFRSRFNEQVNMIRLNCQIEDRPLLFECDLYTQFAQSFRHVTNQDFFATGRYPHEVVIHLIDCMVRALEFVRHSVDSIPLS